MYKVLIQSVPMLHSEVAFGVQLPNSWFILGVPPIAFSQRTEPKQNAIAVGLSASIPHVKRNA